jgi:hypothetical protein
MFKRKILPPIFVVLPAAAALTAQTATVERPMRAGLGPAPRRSRAPAVWLAARLHHSRGRLEPVELMAS